MVEQRVQRKLAAILAADVVGYSRLVEADEAGTVARLKSLRIDVIQPLIDEDGGRVVKLMGDGVLVEFPSAIDAVRNALAIQAEMARRNADIPEERRIAFRIGINVGDVIIDGDDIQGDGVNVAARLEGLCEPGQVFVSGTVYDQAAGKLEASFDDLGERTVKNVARPIRVYRARAGFRPAAERGAPGARPSVTDKPAIAVLPLLNISGDAAEDFFADGLTEDIIAALARWRSFPVIARNSTFSYKGKAPDVRRIAEELGARYVLEGSVRRGGNRVRVVVQLIDAETGHHVMAERYDREIQDIFALQDEMALRIAAIIEPEIEQAEKRRIAAKHPDHLAAWEYCIRGFACVHEATQDRNEAARDLFGRAIALDPRYARAHTGLAYTHFRDLRFGWSGSADRSAELGFQAARQAIALDPSDAEPRTMLVRGYQMVGQFQAAVEEGRRAVALNPFDAYAQVVLGNALMMLPECREEAVSSLTRALELNPQDPQNFQIRTFLAAGYLCIGRYDMAVDLARTASRDNPDFIESHIVLASALGHLDRGDEARIALGKFNDEALAYVDGRPTWTEEMRSLVLSGLGRAGLRRG